MTYPMDSYRNKVPVIALPCKLDVGAGAYPKEGFVRIDFDPCNGATDIIWDIARAGIPLPDRSCCEIYSSHFLEHLVPVDYHFTLQEFFRVAANGCRIEIRLPYGNLPEGGLPCHYNKFRESDMQAINIWFPHDTGTYWDLQSVTRDGIHLIGVFMIVKP